MQNKKIVFFSTDNNASSGAFISMVVLNDYLNKKFGIKSEIILPKKGTGDVLLQEKNIRYKIIRSYDWLVPVEKKDDIKSKCIFLIKKLLNVIAVGRIRRELKRIRPDLVHVNTIYGYVGAIAAKKENIPIIWHFREIIEKGHGKTFADKDYSQKIINYADAVIAVSYSVLRYYDDLGIKMNNASVIYNGIDINDFYNKDKIILCNQPVKILFVGSFTRIKGAFDLIDAIEVIKKKNKYNILVSFVGNSNAEFDEYLSKSAIKEITRLYGYQKKVANIYKKNDIVVTGAICEAFGRVTAEAMLSGCLVITTDDSGSCELVRNGATGYTYGYGNSKLLAKRIAYAIEHKEESEKIAINGQLFIKNNMNAEQNAYNIALLYEDVLNKR